jgi:hypothetical protein
MKLITAFAKAHRRIISIIVILLMLIAAAGAYVIHTTVVGRAHEATVVASYRALAKVNENAAYIPAASDNPIRQSLDQTLARVLTEKMTDAERLTLAHQGTDLVKQLDAQVDNIGTTNSAVSSYLAGMENVGHFGGSFTTTGASSTGFVSLAKEETSMIEDIRGLSYRADFETQQIFNHIIADKGKLTSQYVIELNNDVPTVEKDFDKRTNLYTSLQDISARIDAGFAPKAVSALSIL